MGENKNKRECQFYVITSTGEQPDAQVCVAGFKEPDGIGVSSQINGGGQDVVRLVDSLAKHMMKVLRENDVDGNQEAAFIALLLTTIEDYADQKALTRAMEMMDEAKSKKSALEKALEHMAENPAAALKALAKVMEEMGTEEEEEA